MNARFPCIHSVRTPLEPGEVTYTRYRSPESTSRRVAWARSSSLGTAVRPHLKDKGKKRRRNQIGSQPQLYTPQSLHQRSWRQGNWKLRACLHQVASSSPTKETYRGLSRCSLWRAKDVCSSVAEDVCNTNKAPGSSKFYY